MNRPATETWQPDRGNRLLALIFMTLGVTLASMTSLWLPSIAPNVAADLGIDEVPYSRSKAVVAKKKLWW